MLSLSLYTYAAYTLCFDMYQKYKRSMALPVVTHWGCKQIAHTFRQGTMFPFL